MRISDWSSDVCSSDLLLHRGFLARDDALLDEGAADGIEGMAVGAGKAHPLHAAVGEDDAARALDMEEEGIHRVSRPGKLEPAPGEGPRLDLLAGQIRSEEHTSDLQSLMRISYAVFCLKKNKNTP